MTAKQLIRYLERQDPEARIVVGANSEHRECQLDDLKSWDTEELMTEDGDEITGQVVFINPLF